MKVVQINATCGYGSTGKIAVDISKFLTEKNIENYVFYAENESEYPLGIRYADNRYLKIQALKTRVFGNYGFQARYATKSLLKKLDEIKPDIIHLHNLHSHNINLELLFKYIKKNSIKTIWTFHDCWAITGCCAYFDYIDCKGWKKDCKDCPKWREMSWFFNRTEELFKKKKELFSGIDLTIVTPSEWLKGLVEQSFLKECETYVINNGIDLSVFSPTESDFRKRYGLGGKKVLLGVAMGFDGNRKGFYDFLKLAERLDEKHVLVLVGVSENQKRSLPEGIIGIERTENQKELARVYTSADIFVNLTYEDNFPTVNLEALACGTPVITYRSGGSAEVADDKVAFSAGKGDLDGVISSINKIEKNEKLSKMCRISAENAFDKNYCFEKYLDLYDRVEKD